MGAKKHLGPAGGRYGAKLNPFGYGSGKPEKPSSLINNTQPTGALKRDTKKQQQQQQLALGASPVLDLAPASKQTTNSRGLVVVRSERNRFLTSNNSTSSNESTAIAIPTTTAATATGCYTFQKLIIVACYRLCLVTKSSGRSIRLLTDEEISRAIDDAFNSYMQLIFGDHNCAATQDSYTDNPGGATSGSQSNGRARNKRDRAESNGRGGNDENPEDSSKRTRRTKREPGDRDNGGGGGGGGGGDDPSRSVFSGSRDTRPQSCWQCPFFLFDSERYQGCLMITMNRIIDVRTHIKRRHTQVAHCPLCGRPFLRDKDRDEHIRRRSCIPVSNPGANLPGATRHMLDRIASSADDRQSRPTTNEQRWYVIWDILFPGHQRPPNPHTSPNIAQNLVMYHTRRFIVEERAHLSHEAYVVMQPFLPDFINLLSAFMAPRGQTQLQAQPLQEQPQQQQSPTLSRQFQSQQHPQGLVLVQQQQQQPPHPQQLSLIQPGYNWRTPTGAPSTPVRHPVQHYSSGHSSSGLMANSPPHSTPPRLSPGSSRTSSENHPRCWSSGHTQTSSASSMTSLNSTDAGAGGVAPTVYPSRLTLNHSSSGAVPGEGTIAPSHFLPDPSAMSPSTASSLPPRGPISIFQDENDDELTYWVDLSTGEYFYAVNGQVIPSTLNQDGESAPL